MSSLHVDSISKCYGNHQVLTDIYLSCRTGEIVGLLGRNGSGKSTLLKIILGAIPSDSRYVNIDKQRIAGLFQGRNLISYLPQDSFLLSNVKVKNLISYVCDKDKIAHLSENDHIKPLLNRKSNELSGGERRLLELHIIIFSRAKFILIDEPFNGVAPVYKEEIKDLIISESKRKGFIITDHDYRNILDIATKIILLHDGGTKEIKDQHALKDWGYLPEI